MDKTRIRQIVGYIIIINCSLLGLGAILQYAESQFLVIFGGILYLISYIVLPFTVTALVYNKWRALGWMGIVSYVFLMVGSPLVAIYQFLKTSLDSNMLQAKALLAMKVLGVSFNWLGLIILVIGIILIAMTMLRVKVYHAAAARLMLTGVVIVIVSELSPSLEFLWPIGVAVISAGVATTSLDFTSRPKASKSKKK